jgi:hypothetical protein
VSEIGVGENAREKKEEHECGSKKESSRESSRDGKKGHVKANRSRSRENE